MSASSERGLLFERQVRKMTAFALKLEIKRDLQSGAGIHKQDIRDRYGELPIFIECKDHQTIKPKEWWREADAKSSHGQAPVVVFPDNEEVLCVMRYSDLLSMIKEGMDWRTLADELRKPVFVATDDDGDEAMEEFAAGGILATDMACQNGHITDDDGYCMVKNCRYSRGYKTKKEKPKWKATSTG